MKKVMIIALLIVGMVFIPAASAEAFYDNTFSEFTDTSGHSVDSRIVYDSYSPFSSLQATDITKLKNMYYITITAPYEIRTNEASPKPIAAGSHPFTATVSGRTFNGNFHYEKNTNILGQVTSSRITYFFDDWDVDGLQGSLPIAFSPFIALHDGDNGEIVMDGDSLLHVNQNNQYGWHTPTNYEIYHTSGITWENRLVVNEVALDDYKIDIIRLINGEYHPSTIKIIDEFDNTTVESGLLADQTFWLRKSDANKIELTSPDTTYIIPLVSVTDDPAVTVYVKNSQTGALISNTHIEIQDTTTDPWTEVVNQTIPSGQVTISLPKDTGIHPTQYRIGATVPCYQQVVPALFFRVTGPTNVIVEMEPIEGGPVNEDNAFVEFYVRDSAGNAVANANVQVDGQLRWTNAQGYTQFEVAKNASYPYVVTKTGYLTIEGIATVESDDRYVVNVALMAGAIPTHPTPTPTITVEPTPTSPIQEDNLIGLSVKGLAKGFGIDYDTALLMFGLMIIFGAGGIVMSSGKGGAMEFIAGSIVGTFVAFALGLIPIWIFIIIAVVFGAYVLRVFIQGGQ